VNGKLIKVAYPSSFFYLSDSLYQKPPMPAVMCFFTLLTDLRSFTHYNGEILRVGGKVAITIDVLPSIK